MNAENPYRLPPTDAFGRPTRYMVHVSGGATSAYMLRMIMDAHAGALPDHAVACFTNTGKEREETYDFLRDIGDNWNVDIVWLEYRHYAMRSGGAKSPKHDLARVTYSTAARRGEPFAQLIASRTFMPNPTRRICTSVLKVETADRYARRRLGWVKPWSVLGIRRDEPQRIGKAVTEACRSVYPLYDAGVDRETVNAWWSTQPFRLRLRSDQGNCDLCFLKGKAKLIGLIREDPKRADWWIEQERRQETRPGRKPEKSEQMQFKKEYKYADLRRMALSGDLLDMANEKSVEEEVSCFCTE